MIPLRLFGKVIPPASLPTMLVGVRPASTIAMLAASEMVGAKAGLGSVIIYAQDDFLIPQIYFGILAITVLGPLSNYALVSLDLPFDNWGLASASA